MNWVLCLTIPVVLFLTVLFICKKMNFSILPKGLRMPPVKKFKFPNLKRNGYTWEVEESESDEEEFDYEESESDEEEIDYEESESDEEEYGGY